MIDEDEMRQALNHIGQEDVALDEIYKIIGNDDKMKYHLYNFWECYGN